MTGGDVLISGNVTVVLMMLAKVVLYIFHRQIKIFHVWFFLEGKQNQYLYVFVINIMFVSLFVLFIIIKIKLHYHQLKWNPSPSSVWLRAQIPFFTFYEKTGKLYIKPYVL